MKLWLIPLLLALFCISTTGGARITVNSVGRRRSHSARLHGLCLNDIVDAVREPANNHSQHGPNQIFVYVVSIDE